MYGVLTENSVRHIDAIREMEALKHEYQVRCSHFELQYSTDDNSISCSICSKRWLFHERRGFQKTLEIYTAERDQIEQ
jgi:DNA-directed RNA polymerase subunit RPC12/RpoP